MKGDSSEMQGKEAFASTPTSPKVLDLRSLCQVPGDDTIRYSRGFLRAGLAGFFPGLETRWLPLAHSFAHTLRVVGVTPMLSPDTSGQKLYLGSFEDELFAVGVEKQAYLSLAEVFASGATEAGAATIIEYLARRFIASLAMTFSASESFSCFFESEAEPSQLSPVASVELRVTANEIEIPLTIFAGERLVQVLDGMWRRHVRSQRRSGFEERQNITFELAQLAVAPEEITEYIRVGSVVDCEANLSGNLLLRLAGKEWKRGRLAVYKNGLAAEVLGEIVGPLPQLPTGTSRLSINIAQKTATSDDLAEMSQDGAYVGIREVIGSELILTIHDSQVALAEALEFEGRLAYRVIRDLRSS